MAETKGPQMTLRYGAYALQADLSRLHARMHTSTRLRTHMYARTQTPIINTSCFSTATMIRKRASMLRYPYIV